MADVEKRVEKLEEKQFNLEVQVSNLSTKVDAFIEEMRDFKNETRSQNLLRAKEIAELRQKQDAAQAKHDAEMREANEKHAAEMKELNEKIDSKFDKLASQIQNIAIAAVIGVGAIVWAVVSALR